MQKCYDCGFEHDGHHRGCEYCLYKKRLWEQKNRDRRYPKIKEWQKAHPEQMKKYRKDYYWRQKAKGHVAQLVEASDLSPDK